MKNPLARFQPRSKAAQERQVDEALDTIRECREGTARHLEKRYVPDAERVIANDFYKLCGRVEEMTEQVRANIGAEGEPSQPLPKVE